MILCLAQMTLLSMPHLFVCHHTDRHESLLCGVLLSFIVFNQHLSFQHFFFFFLCLSLSLFKILYTQRTLQAKHCVSSKPNPYHYRLVLICYVVQDDNFNLTFNCNKFDFSKFDFIHGQGENEFMRKEKQETWPTDTLLG